MPGRNTGRSNVRGRNVQAVEAADEEDTGRVNPAVQGDQALTRGLALLDIVANFEETAPFSEIADAAGLAKGTVHRMLAALVEARFLQLDSRDADLSPGRAPVRDGASRLERIRPARRRGTGTRALAGRDGRSSTARCPARRGNSLHRPARGYAGDPPGQRRGWPRGGLRDVSRQGDPRPSRSRHAAPPALDAGAQTLHAQHDHRRRGVGTRARSHRRAWLCHLRRRNRRPACTRSRPRSSIIDPGRSARSACWGRRSVSTSTSCMRWGAR